MSSAILDSGPRKAGEPGTSSKQTKVILEITPINEIVFFTGDTAYLRSDGAPFSDHTKN